MADTTTIALPQELFALAESSSFSGAYTLDTLEIGPDTYTITTPVTWSVTVTNTGGAFLMSGSAHAHAVCACARCAEDAHYELESEIEEYILIHPDPELEEDDEIDYLVLPEDHEIDMAPIVECALILDLPLVPLCRDDCKGVCPDCGQNLNEGTCDCAQKRAEVNAEFEAHKNPFSALSDLKLDN